MMNSEQLQDKEIDSCIDEYLEKLGELIQLKISRSQKKIENLEDLEIFVRDFMLSRVGPELTEKLIEYLTGIQRGRGRKRKIKTIIGEISINKRQADYLELESYKKYSPKMEKNAMLICANESYQNAEKDFEELTGIKISHSTLHRSVLRQDFELPTSKLGVKEVAVDGGKVRLRTEEKGKPCEYKDYKAVSLNGVDYGAFFQDSLGLIDWVNCQKLLTPFYCLGDGHPGIWNIVKEFGELDNRIEILDWYHLKENIYKVGGSLKRLKQAEKLLWNGKIDEAILLFKTLKKKAAQNFCNYLEKHRSRIVNYNYSQLESISSVGSGSVESLIKLIGTRVKISGAQWKNQNVPKILDLRCAYLNGAFYT